jgi:hypothetical protein
MSLQIKKVLHAKSFSRKFKTSSLDTASLDKVSETPPSVHRSIQTSTQEIHLIHEEVRKAEEALAIVITALFH